MLTTQQLQWGLIGSIMCMAGAPSILLHAFFYRAERLVLKKSMRVLVHIVGAGVFTVLTGFFIYFFLPGNWQWVQWVNVGIFVLTLLICMRRLRVWYACNRAGDVLTIGDLGMVLAFAYDSLGYNVEIKPSGLVYLRVTVRAVVYVMRGFKVAGMDAQTVMSELSHRACQAATPTDSNPRPKVQYERDGLDTAPVRVIKMMHDTESSDMLVYVN